MADTKVTGLDENTAPVMTDIMYIVDDPGGTPASQKITLDTLLTMQYGQLYTSGGSGTQTPGTSYAKVTQWGTNGLSSGDITPDATNDKIIVSAAGVYFVAFQASFTGTTGSVVNAAVFWNGVEQSQVGFQRKLGTGTDVGSASSVGVIDVTSAPTDIDFRVKCDGAGDDFDLKEGQLIAFRVGGT